jgi:aspartokinase-like uncharacterized kinase
MSTDSPILVAKLGGSLLTWPGLRDALGRWLSRQSGRRVLLIPGGGPAADFIRDLDRLHALGGVACHALALRCLDLTAHALAAIVPGLTVVEDFPAMAESWSANRVPILAPRRVLDADDALPGALEHSWRVTSDSIAARVAVLLGADLLLFKSAPLPRGFDAAEASGAGLVDEAFPEVSRSLPRVAYLNLREAPSGPRPPTRINERQLTAADPTPRASDAGGGDDPAAPPDTGPPQVF